MKTIFLGVGEAFDENLINTSILILSKTNLLLDCGYSVPQSLWKYNPDPEFLDAVFISHCHADHYFGLPLIVYRMFQGNRQKLFKIICQKGLKKRIEELFSNAYMNLLKKAEFLKFIEVEEGQSMELNEFKLSFAPTIHSADNLAVKIKYGNTSVCYSGDGMFSEKTEKLYANSDLVIQETFLFDQKQEGHVSIVDAAAMAKKNKIKCLALVHIDRNMKTNKNEMDKIKKFISKEKLVKIIIPEPLQEYDF